MSVQNHLPSPPASSPPPRWLARLATFDGVDTVLLFFGLPTGYAAGGVAGLFGAGLLLGGQMLVRKTPLLPTLWRSGVQVGKVLQGDAGAQAQVLRQVFLFLEDQQAGLNAGIREEPGTLPPQPQAKTLPARPQKRRTAQYRGLQPLPPLHGAQIVVYGPTKSGKSSVLKALIQARPDAQLIIVDPHYEPGNWPSRATVVGAGLQWAAIGQALATVLAEMQHRYHLLATQPRGAVQFRDLVLVVDEMSALTMEVPEAGKHLLTLAQQGRKVKIWTMLTPHSTEVAQMGAQGRGDARENFAYVEMPPVREEDKHKPRIVTLYYGNPRRANNEAAGQFIVPAPRVYRGTPTLNPPQLFGRPQGVPEDVLEGVPASPEHTLSRKKHTPGTGRPTLEAPPDFWVQCTPDTDETRRLIDTLLRAGFGLRKISLFLPFANAPARARVRERQTSLSGPIPARPLPDSEAERALVNYLRELGAPLPRIARLLDGNDAANLTRLTRKHP